ncbi:M3 family metallopeptidase [Oricola cellulosilytica]|uniref:M3 family peptidase n=1 Tax=Oricola cellulosilytica TaxID=1429082 RepID=A0A4R0PES9_9HYPH|nr:M3 family metallopeptidase [Oricola cellulosilytica]TCD13883.1 M3 family peptidase [Oricola cellulosilytica]
MPASSNSSPLTDWTGAYGLPDFSAIRDEEFEPAIRAAFDAHLAEIRGIADNPEPPDFANTIAALEIAGEDLSRVSAIFFNRAGSHTNDLIRQVERTVSPLYARHRSAVAMNRALFARIDALWAERDSLGLTTEQYRVLERRWKGFVRSGAALEGAARERYAEITERLATLGTQFGQNVLKDESDWILLVEDDGGLDGLPDWLIDAMASVAEERGHAGRHAVSLSRSIADPFLTFSTRRDLRERVYNAWLARGENGGETDNTGVIAETLALRREQAALLGYASYAAYKLDDTMAKTPENVSRLLETVWEKGVARANEEAADIESMIAADGHNHKAAKWDWRFYAEKIRRDRFDFSDADVKPYLQLERMIEAAFAVATRLFGITFEEINDVPLYHPDARLWRVSDRDGSHRALFIGDYFARPSKRSGAWMSALQTQAKLTGETPIVLNTMNFAKPPAGKPALLSFDDARTLFHEFGHALHGMLSDVTYPSVSGTSVSRDFVELPSQLYEHWLTVPEVLDEFAVHAETGKSMPKELLDKVLAAQTFNIGFQTVEYTSSALVDMAYHAGTDVPAEPAEFEAGILQRIGIPDAIAMRHRSPHFQHIFAGDGYAAGYYSYMWSEVMDADAFRAFEETGDPFNPDIARKLRRHIYASGGTIDPEDAYKAFRGRLPTPDAMLEERGLA